MPGADKGEMVVQRVVKSEPESGSERRIDELLKGINLFPEKEYVFVVTERNEGIRKAVKYAQKHIGPMLREVHEKVGVEDSGLELVIRQVPSFLLAITAWEQHPLETLLLVVDKRDPNSPDAKLKLFHSDIDTQLITAVIDTNAVRTEPGEPSQKVQTIDPELFTRTLALEIAEMRRDRNVKLARMDDTQRLTHVKELLYNMRNYLPVYEPFFRTKKRLNGFTEEEAVVHLTQDAETRLHLVVKTLHDHYNTDNLDSKSRVEAAAKVLKEILERLPPGITYLTEEAREGVFVITRTLKGANIGKAYAIKRFETPTQAKHVHALTEWLREKSESQKDPGRVLYLQIPRTYWPVVLNGQGAIFMDAIPGIDLLNVFPEINEAIRNGSTDARIVKRSIDWTVLNNLAYWQNVSEEAATQLGGYEKRPEQIRRFVQNAFVKSLETLKEVTDLEIGKKQEMLVNESASNLARLISETAAWGLDLGLRNIRAKMNDHEKGLEGYLEEIRAATPGGAIGPIQTASTIVELDLPSEWKTVHWMRDVVRYSFAPANEPQIAEAVRDAAYVLLRVNYLKERNPEKRIEIEVQMYKLLRGEIRPEDVQQVQIEFRLHPYDLAISAAAEAARMNRFIPIGFLGKIEGMIKGKTPRSSTPEKLGAKFDELVEENHQWATSGLLAAYELKRTMMERSEDRHLARKIVSGLEFLYNSWMEATIQRERLPRYEQFMKV